MCAPSARAFEPFFGQIERDYVLAAAIDRPHYHAQPDRPAPEDYDPVARLAWARLTPCKATASGSQIAAIYS